ncbi:thioredoxin reductase [Penicillium taxi]|uniref:thioredoxin reductase n=1 Tax=Penicillium taxi TaxID=168475 RepID=UPI00254546AF|nr:thioredoxin reductase [Penicillium taxi]KAJ5901477.1 thioredoxin reductase [Penicillium taxi]
MPVITDFVFPRSPEALTLPQNEESTFFLIFTTSNDPKTGQSWCPDVRAALPYLKASFASQDSPQAAWVEVGQRDPDALNRWRVSTNVYRTKWNVHNVPTLVRYQRIDGQVKETGRLVEREILDSKKLKDLIKPEQQIYSD